jgi:hypothetical protein
MSALRLADVLPDFALHEPSLPTRIVEPAFRAAPDPAEIERRIAVAVAAAEEALAARLFQEHEAARNALKETHDRKVEELQHAMGETIGRLVEERLSEAEARILQFTETVAARILAMIAGEAVSRRAVAALADLIRMTIADREALRIRITGPLSLFEPLRAALGDRAMQLEFVETEAIDLIVTIDETQFETRLSDWSEALAGVLA